jgi:putative mRNA 3-end processing factor
VNRTRTKGSGSEKTPEKKVERAPETGDLFAPRGAASIIEDVPSPVPDDQDRADAPEDDEEDEPVVEPVAEAERAPTPRPRLDVSFGEPVREFEYNGGIHLTESILWCDADRRSDLSFISHAHNDFIGKNRRILATDKTVRIITRASGKVEALTSPYRRSFTLGPLTMEMHPAGHVLGSAQLLITRDGKRLVYTSDVNPRQTATTERARPIPCDTLVIPATYGLPMFRFPPREEVYEAIKKFVERCLEDRATPVLIANQIGTSQELMRMLGEAGYRMRVHRSIYDIAKIYRELGVNIDGARRFGGTPARDEVVIFPPILRKHASIRKLRKSETAMVSGNAADPGYVFRHRVDAAFPLSDCADYEDLVAFIQETGATEVYLSSGFIDEMSADLRARGIRVYSLVKPQQLSLF